VDDLADTAFDRQKINGKAKDKDELMSVYFNAPLVSIIDLLFLFQSK